MRRFLATLLLIFSATTLAAQSTRCEAPWPLGDKPWIDPQDESFDGGFDAPWTVASGNLGTVDRFLTTATPTAVYDFSTIQGVMLVQHGPYAYNHATPTQVLLYQAFELGDGQSWTLAVAAAHGGNENGYNVGAWLSNSTTSPINYPALTPYVGIQVDAEFAQGPRLVATANNTHLAGQQPNQTSNTEEIVLLRITRRGLTYTMDWSNNWGLTWSFLGRQTQTAPMQNLWTAIQSWKPQSAIFNLPIHAILWGCLGGDGYNPW